MKRIISVILVTLFIFSLCSVFSATELTQKQVIENFKNGVYVGDWVPCTLSEETVRDMAECGIQYTFLWFFSWDNPQKVQELEWCSKYGIKVFLQDDSIYGFKMETMTEEQIYEIIKPSIGNPNILGYSIVDEPVVSQYDRLEVCLEKFKAVAEGMIPFVNIYGYTYGHYIDGVFTQLNQDFISMDAYPMINETIVPEWYNGVRAVGDSARKHNGDMWLFLQSMGWPGADRDPQLDDMRWQLYGAIAYGATKLTHFCYSNPYNGATHDQTFKDSIPAVNNGVKTPKYDIIKQFNSEVQYLAPTLAKYYDLGVFYVPAIGDDAQQNIPAYLEVLAYNPQNFDFRSIKTIRGDQYLLVGGFQSKTDALKKAFVVANTANSYYDIEADVEFTLRYSNRPVTVIMDGTTTTLYPDENGVFRLHLGSGGGAFIEFEERERTEEEVFIDESLAVCNLAKNTYLEACADLSQWETNSFHALETFVMEYEALTPDNIAVEQLSVLREQAEEAVKNLKTVLQAALMTAQSVITDYEGIIPELFDATQYAEITNFIKMLQQELGQENLSAIRINAVAAKLLKLFETFEFTGMNGDMNLDKKVSLADIMLMARMVVGVDKVQYTYKRIADMNQDDLVKLDDILIAAKQALMAS